MKKSSDYTLSRNQNEEINNREISYFATGYDCIYQVLDGNQNDNTRSSSSKKKIVSGFRGGFVKRNHINPDEKIRSKRMNEQYRASRATADIHSTLTKMDADLQIQRT